jgi:translation initiation factor 6
VPLVAGTVNRGSDVIGAGLCVNDWCAFAGYTTTSHEIAIVEKIFNLQERTSSKLLDDIRSSLVDVL